MDGRLRTVARTVGLVAIGVALTALPSSADQTVAPTLVRPPSIVRLQAPWLSTLRTVAATGDGARLVAAVFELLADLRRAGIASGCCDPARDYFLVSFVGADATGTPALTTVIAHDPMPASAELPGVHGPGHPLYQLFLADDLSASLQATYTIVHEENPGEKAAGDFAALVIGHLALPLALRTAAPETANQAAPFDVAVTFSRVVLPEAGRIALHQTITYTDPMGHLTARIAALDRNRPVSIDAHVQADALAPACAALNTRLHDRVDSIARGAGCGLWPADLTACTKKLREGIAEAASAYFADAPACPIADGAPLVQALLAAVQDVKALTATTAIANAALVRYSFGLAAGYMPRIDVDRAHPRAQLQSGQIVSAPFPRQLTMGVVNLTPWGYDSQRQSPSIGERARLIAGFAFSPYFGVAGGGAFAINRYLAIDGGYARLWFDTPKPGESIGAAPTSANSAAPFELRSIGALFVGVSYNFK